MLRARLLAVLLGVVGVLALAGPASAHVGDGRAGSDFDGAVLSVTPDLPGVTVRVLQFGDELEVVNSTGTELEVPGYSGEPYLRIGPDGVWRNRLSPATTINLDRYGRTPLPADADPDPAAEPDWVQVSTQPQYTWHDHRTHWMSEGQLPPAVAADPTVDHTVFAWTVPMTYGERDVEVAGELTWSPPPPAWLLWPVYVVLLSLVVLAGLRGPAALGGALGLGAAASLWHALATPAPAVTQGGHLGAVLSALLPALLVTGVAVLGVRAARRGRGGLTGVLAVVAGWLLLVQGLPDVDVLWTAHVLTTGPTLLGRAAVAVLLAGGAGLVVGGVLAARRSRDAGSATVPA
ncbi:hypothetical protein SAMN03159343_0158 [Klenkia marina]|uniref:Uncharacterized protein n=1 Tax=Klenkia marina TaxID=1960309 RepID=A0A1G4X8W5_9ACTN|nr:hypothetical protein [Klenkia marina]SCX37645.1 hypothetical protein SAMN03159343_0158 [Klenkia marina]